MFKDFNIQVTSITHFSRKFDFKKFMYLNYEKEFKAFVHRFSLDPDNPLLWEAFIHETSQSDDNSIEHNGKLAVLGRKFNLFVCTS